LPVFTLSPQPEKKVVQGSPQLTVMQAASPRTLSAVAIPKASLSSPMKARPPLRPLLFAEGSIRPEFFVISSKSSPKKLVIADDKENDSLQSIPIIPEISVNVQTRRVEENDEKGKCTSDCRGSVRPQLSAEQIAMGYYTKPDLSQINLQSGVHNLEVGRKGFGSIRFMDTVFLKDVNLQKDVVITAGVVEVYPTCTAAPPVGHGLNSRAIITLENIRPPPSISDPARFAARIAKTTEKFGGKLVMYDVDKGIWQFAVEHF
jgi:hypothetical protein